MKKGRLKEENVAKISITAEGLEEVFDDCIEVLEEVDEEEINKLEKLLEKERRLKSN